jgi:electron transfer flavoprotein alpha/beta subunit
VNADLVLAGQASDDYEAGQVGAQVAALANLPVISNVVSIDREGMGYWYAAIRKMATSAYAPDSP